MKNYGGELRLKSVLAPGTKVSAGDVIAEIDASDYERLLGRSRESAMMAEQGLAAAQDAFEQAPRAMALQLLKAQRDLARAEDSLAFWAEKEKGFRLKNIDLSEQSQADNLADQEEELRQLEKLYHGNDLAKESQDIVLNRSKRSLARSKENFAQAKERNKRAREIDIPRQEEDLKAALEGAKLEHEKVTKANERGNTEAQSRLIRARQANEDAARALKDIEADQGGFVLKAPHNGVVVVGGLAGNNSVSAGIKAGDKLRNGQPLACVIDTGTLKVTFTFAAGSRDKVAPGGHVDITASGVAAQAKVTAVGFIVDARGRLSASAEINNADGKLLPGMRAEAKIQ
jgi:multidrug resistance efflux pump